MLFIDLILPAFLVIMVGWLMDKTRYFSHRLRSVLPLYVYIDSLLWPNFFINAHF